MQDSQAQGTEPKSGSFKSEPFPSDFELTQ